MPKNPNPKIGVSSPVTASARWERLREAKFFLDRPSEVPIRAGIRDSEKPKPREIAPVQQQHTTIDPHRSRLSMFTGISAPRFSSGNAQENVQKSGCHPRTRPPRTRVLSINILPAQTPVFMSFFGIVIQVEPDTAHL